jgi:hypothetical protein
MPLFPTAVFLVAYHPKDQEDIISDIDAAYTDKEMSYKRCQELYTPDGTWFVQTLNLNKAFYR